VVRCYAISVPRSAVQGASRRWGAPPGSPLRKPPDAWRLAAQVGAVERVCRASGLRLYLLGGIVLEADGMDEVHLRLQPLNMFLALDDQVLEELPCAGITLL
jgi:hypothetical protein